MAIEPNPKRRNIGVVDTTPRRLPAKDRQTLDDLCIDPSLTCREIRQRMISEGFRMNLAGIEKYDREIRRRVGLRRYAGRRPALAGRGEAIAQILAWAAVLLAGDSGAKQAIKRASEIAGLRGGSR
jgi:hypothetical protein